MHPPGHDETDPAPSLLEHLERLPSGRCLDLACGSGRNGLALARRGDTVEGWDRDAEALAHFRARAHEDALASRVTLRAIDLEQPDFRPPPGRFQSVLVFRYLWRALAPVITELLVPNGVLLYETFTADPAGRGGPRNPEFILRRGELPLLFPALRVESFREHLTEQGHAFATLVARRPG